eukprot:29467-Pelagococcus_subviridis.AAC.4
MIRKRRCDGANESVAMLSPRIIRVRGGRDGVENGDDGVERALGRRHILGRYRVDEEVGGEDLRREGVRARAREETGARARLPRLRLVLAPARGSGQGEQLRRHRDRGVFG